MQNIKLGLSGDVASFSEQAALEYANKNKLQVELVPLMDMEGVLAALEKKQIDLGIFPVMNFTGGLVTMAFEAMGKHYFTPIGELYLDVQQCLITRPGITKQNIQEIVSHPQGLAQCQKYLQREFPNATQVEWIDTAKAAKDLSEHVLSANTAVIAPARAATCYGLNILNANIQDQQPNNTVFIVVRQLAMGQ
jgi:prephenate dehydratase